MTGARATCALAVLLSGCFNPSYTDQGFRCDKTRACPDGYQCLKGAQGFVCTTQSELPDAGPPDAGGVIAVGGWRMVFDTPTHDCTGKEFIELTQSVFYIESATDSEVVLLRGGRVTCPFAGGRLSCPPISSVASRVKGGELSYSSSLTLEPTSTKTANVDFTETFTSCTGPECPPNYPCRVQYTGKAGLLAPTQLSASPCSAVSNDPPGPEHALVLVVNNNKARRVVYRFDSQKESLVKSLAEGDNVLIVAQDKSWIVIRDDGSKCLQAYSVSKDTFNVIQLMK